MKQSTALRILQSGHNVFLTGSAGTGKTYLLNQYLRQLRHHGVAVAVTASTGIAATHIGGTTIHSWSGLGIKDELTRNDLDKIARKKPLRERIERAKVLVIDEVSMLSRRAIENIDEILRYVRLTEEPFGGLQIIFCGDFFQLPPVSRTRLTNAEKFAFMSPTWVKANLQICYLTDQYRQSEDDLADFLNDMRDGELPDSRIDQLHECMRRTAETTPDARPTRLYTHNADVDAINARELKAIESPPLTYNGKSMGERKLVESLQKSILAHKTLVLKQGADVMFVKNNPEQGYSNGTLGTVTGFSLDGFPIVTTRTDKTITATPSEWRIVDVNGKAAASFSQIPLRLAWAITVHKSQGMTLDSAEIDLSKTFEPGQGYVALSRVKGWSGLRLLGCNGNALQMDPLVRRADARFQELSDEAVEKFPGLNVELEEEAFYERVRRLGGTTDPDLMANNELLSTAPIEMKKKEPKVSTYLLTQKLVEQKKTIAEMVASRSMTEETIVKHLQVLRETVPELEMNYLKPAPIRMAKMAMGFAIAKTKAGPNDRDKDGEPSLRFVFELLKEEFFYRELKLAQLFLQ